MSAIEDMLAVERSGTDMFTATIPFRRVPRLFGGQVAGQALVAACRTLPEPRSPHSLHAYFVRLGQPGVPVRYEVTRVRDGRSFTTRRVTATQDDRTIFEAMASFQNAEEGANWQPPAPDLGARPSRPPGVPHPRLGHVVNHLDLRPIRDHEGGWRIHPYWVRTDPPIGDDVALNAAALTYVSDIAFMANAREPGTDLPMAAAASIDHSIWFHRPPRTDDWLFFSAEPVANIGTRGMVRGAFHTEGGELVATVAQEALLRPATP